MVVPHCLCLGTTFLLSSPAVWGTSSPAAAEQGALSTEPCFELVLSARI